MADTSTLYVGDANGISRNVPELYYGDPNGIARKCKLFYGDPNGIARLIIGEGGEPQPTILSTLIDYDFGVSNVDRITGFTPTGSCSYDSANGWLNLTGNWTFLSQENIPMNIPANASTLVLETEIDLSGRTRGTDDITFRIGEGGSGRTIFLGQNTWINGYGNYNIYENNKNKGFFNMRCVIAIRANDPDFKNYLYIDNILIDTVVFGWSMPSTLNHMLAQNFNSSPYGTWKIKKYKLYYI